MLDNIISRIKEIQLKSNSIVLVGIDGGGGSGKSTLATQIASSLQDAQIAHMDDFYKLSEFRKITNLADAPSGYEYDIDRLISQVITPLLSNKAVDYQKYDWVNDCLIGGEKVVPTGVLMIEGCYSTINRLSSFYQLKIFVDCSKPVRLKRGLERDGESALPFWINWMNGEDKYFEEQNTKNNADIIFVGEGTL